MIDELRDILQAAQLLTGLRRKASAEGADAVTIDIDIMRALEVATWGAFAQLKFFTEQTESETLNGD